MKKNIKSDEEYKITKDEIEKIMTSIIEKNNENIYKRISGEMENLYNQIFRLICLTKSVSLYDNFFGNSKEDDK